MRVAIFLWGLSLLSSSIAFAPFAARYGKGVFNKIRHYGTDDKSEKLVFDTKENRFYEADVAKLCEEEFCLVDADTGAPILLTKEEKERIFLDCVQSYYATGKTILTDEQYDRLKEDLSFEGSPLVTLTRNETLFVSAIQAWKKGTPLMPDTEFDALKVALRESGSKIAVEGDPTCLVETGVCKVTWKKDTIRTATLYVPASLFFGLILLALDLDIPFLERTNPLVVLALGAYPIYTLAKEVTENFLFKEPLVAAGPCPKCGVENRVLFGDVLGVQGDVDEAGVKCTNCKETMTVKRQTLRVSTLADNKKGAPPAKVAA